MTLKSLLLLIPTLNCSLLLPKELKTQNFSQVDDKNVERKEILVKLVIMIPDPQHLILNIQQMTHVT